MTKRIVNNTCKEMVFKAYMGRNPSRECEACHMDTENTMYLFCIRCYEAMPCWYRM